MKNITVKINGKIENALLTIYKNTIDEDNIQVYIEAKIQQKSYITKLKETTEQAMIELQNLLPTNINILCCQSCKHGNFCPVGNYDNEIFCVKDFIPTQKSDLYYVTEDDNEREKRKHELFFYCKDYETMRPDYFTYNDWLYSTTEK